MNSIQGGTEFEDAGADAFYGSGERQESGLVEEQDYTVEFAFASAACQGKADGIEEIAAADATGFLQVGGNFLEALGSEWSGFEEQQREMTDDLAGGVTRDGGLGIGRLQDFGSVVVENGTQEIGEGRAVFGVVAEELGGAFGPGEVLGSGSSS